MRLMLVETLSAFLGISASVFLGPIVLFAIDRVVEAPVLARSILTTTSLLWILLLLRRWSHFWIWRPRSTSELARLVQSYFSRLGDSLESAVELSRPQALSEGASLELIRAAMESVSEQSREFDFRAAVPAEEARKRALYAAVGVCILLVGSMLCPAITLNAIQRWAVPWSPLERATFARLEGLPKEITVAHGEPFDLSLRLDAASLWRPKTLGAESTAFPRVDAPTEGLSATLHLPALTRDTNVLLRAGDHTRRVLIRPVVRPELRELEVTAIPPDYLQQEKTVTRLDSGRGSFLAGSRLQFTGVVSRGLSAARLSIYPAGTVLDGEKPLPEPQTQIEAAVQGPVLTVPAVFVGSLTSASQLEWRDQEGLRAMKPFPLHITSVPDAAPTAEMAGVAPDITILEDKVLPIKIAASDDYGLKEIWLGWTLRPALFDNPASPTSPSETQLPAALEQGESKRASGTHSSQKLSTTIPFSPAVEKIRGDYFVDLYACATDFLPDRKPSVSPKVTIRVLSKSTHAELTRRRVDELRQTVSEVTRNQKRLLDETLVVAAGFNEATPEQIADDLARLDENQSANAAQMHNATEELQKALREALQNDSVPEASIAQLQQTVETLRQAVNPALNEAAKALRAAKDQPAKAAEQMVRAADQQRKALEGLQNVAEKADSGSGALRSKNFHTRLLAAAAAQKQLCKELAAMPSAGVGAVPHRLSAPEQMCLHKNALQQESLSRALRALEGDLEAFLEQAPQKQYQWVRDEMSVKNAPAAVEDIAQNVRLNLRYRASERAELWAAQFSIWADVLAGKTTRKSKKQEPSSDPDSAQDPEENSAEEERALAEYLVALTRVAQKQDDLRDQTQALETRRAEPAWAESVAELSERQKTLHKDLEELKEQASVDLTALKTFEGLERSLALKLTKYYPVLSQADGLMQGVIADLQEPRTDAPVSRKQAVIIELLAPPAHGDDEEGKSKSEEEKLQKLMRQLLAKATHTDPSTPPDSPLLPATRPTQKESAKRSLEKGSGLAQTEWPAEFRDALEAFFRSVEKNR